MMYRLLATPLIAVLLAPLGSPVPALAEAPASRPEKAAAERPDNGPSFVRFREDGKGGGTLETAIASYRNRAGVVVHLVAAVHVGEAEYYKGLSETFEGYDALLFELVMPKDAALPGAKAAPDPAGDRLPASRPAGARVRGAGAIGGLQGLMKNALELEFQLDAINYDRPNFVHADLDAETFNAMQSERNESLFGLMLRAVVNEMKRQQSGRGAPPITTLDLLAAMTSPDSARQYKLLLARQFNQIEAQITGMEGKNGSVLIAERNKAALAALERAMQNGDKNIGIFYGAAHMHGIEDVMLKKMGFTRTGEEWRTAWDMRTPAAAAKPEDARQN